MERKERKQNPSTSKRRRPNGWDRFRDSSSLPLLQNKKPTDEYSHKISSGKEKHERSNDASKMHALLVQTEEIQPR